ncbi:MAG: outer membrane beta-barrel protein [Legionella sp.]|nr:outer membrane beta-barrel protein [Legionella sp.]
MRTLVSLSALLFSMNSFGAVPIEGFYLNIFGGYSYLPGNVYRNLLNLDTRLQYAEGHYYTPPPFLLRTSPSYDNGYNGGGRVGYLFWPLQYEVEVSYVSANLKQFKINHIRQKGVEGDSSGTFALGNVYYRFPTIIPNVSPYLSTGIGYGYVTAKLKSLRSKCPLEPSPTPCQPIPASTATTTPIAYPGPLSLTSFRETGSVFAYQGSGGFFYDYSESYSLNIAYRYLGTSGASALGQNFQGHLASLGITFRLDTDSYR